MSTNNTTPQAMREYLQTLRPTSDLYPDAQLFEQAPAAEQAELLDIAWKLRNDGMRNMGPSLAWEVTFALARLAAKRDPARRTP